MFYCGPNCKQIFNLHFLNFLCPCRASEMPLCYKLTAIRDYSKCCIAGTFKRVYFSSSYAKFSCKKIKRITISIRFKERSLSGERETKKHTAQSRNNNELMDGRLNAQSIIGSINYLGASWFLTKSCWSDVVFSLIRVSPVCNSVYS